MYILEVLYFHSRNKNSYDASYVINNPGYKSTASNSNDGSYKSRALYENENEDCAEDREATFKFGQHVVPFRSFQPPLPATPTTVVGSHYDTPVMNVADPDAATGEDSDGSIYEPMDLESHYDIVRPVDEKTVI